MIQANGKLLCRLALPLMAYSWNGCLKVSAQHPNVSGNSFNAIMVSHCCLNISRRAAAGPRYWLAPRPGHPPEGRRVYGTLFPGLRLISIMARLQIKPACSTIAGLTLSFYRAREAPQRVFKYRAHPAGWLERLAFVDGRRGDRIWWQQIFE